LEEGKISGAAMVMRDITKREEAFQTIRTTCRKINELLESIGDAFLSLDDQWRITYANRRAAKTFGFNEGDMGIQSIWDKIPELKDSTVEQTLRQAMAQRMPCRLKFQTRITKTRYWASVYPGALGLSIYIIDATNLEQTLPD
jgi:PAS domain S-box-containing protein